MNKLESMSPIASHPDRTDATASVDRVRRPVSPVHERAGRLDTIAYVLLIGPIAVLTLAATIVLDFSGTAMF